MTSEHHHDVLERLKLALRADTLQELADALGETLGAVKSWSARGSVPLAQLVTASEKSGRSLDWLIRGIEVRPSETHAQSPPPPRYHGVDAADPSFSPRLALAIDIVRAGLAAKGVDVEKVPSAEMAAEVFKLMPWPIPRATQKKPAQPPK